MLATLVLSVQATPAALADLRERQSKTPVSCSANGGTAASCYTKSLTRYGCPHTDTNRCATVGTTTYGATVQIYCYVFGEAVNGNSYVLGVNAVTAALRVLTLLSMWYNLNPRTNGWMPAAFFSCM